MGDISEALSRAFSAVRTDARLPALVVTHGTPTDDLVRAIQAQGASVRSVSRLGNVVAITATRAAARGVAGLQGVAIVQPDAPVGAV